MSVATLTTVIALVIGYFVATKCVFAPYKAHRWRTDLERWTTRDRSHGWPFYYNLQFGPDGWSDQNERHHYTYNRPCKMTRTCKNVIIVE